MQVADGVERVGADYPVGRQTHVALELAHRVFGKRAEDTVLMTRRKPQRPQSPLKLEHVVSMEVGHAEVKRPVADMVGRIDQSRPGALVDLVSRAEGQTLAERPHGGGSCLVVRACDLIIR